MKNDQALASESTRDAGMGARGDQENGSICTAGSPYHYPPAAHVGWTCYHCGETFTTWGSARDHFGVTPDKVAGCVIQAGDPRGLLMELRKREEDVEHWRHRAQAKEDASEQTSQELDEFKRITGCHSSHDLRMWLDSQQGRVVTANVLIEKFRERAPELFAEVIG